VSKVGTINRTLKLPVREEAKLRIPSALQRSETSVKKNKNVSSTEA
jgi:hypothetical protein